MSPCRPSCAHPGRAGCRDASRAHQSLRTQAGPAPWHPAWGGRAPRRYLPPARAGLRFPGGLPARGELPAPRGPSWEKCRGGICGINPPPGPGPHADAGCGGRVCSVPSPCPPAPPWSSPGGQSRGHAAPGPAAGWDRGAPRAGMGTGAGWGRSCSCRILFPEKVPIPQGRIHPTLPGKHPEVPWGTGTPWGQPPHPSTRPGSPIQPHFSKSSQRSSPKLPQGAIVPCPLSQPVPLLGQHPHSYLEGPSGTPVPRTSGGLRR